MPERDIRPLDDDRHGRDQPLRDDLIDPDDVSAEEVDEPTQDADVGSLPLEEELPESQGVDALEAEHWTEDASSRRLLSDEEADLRRVEDGP